MKIVVIGGTGMIGSTLVAKLRAIGHEVLAATPGSGVNAVTGAGLVQALAGAQIVVDLVNPPTADGAAAQAFFEASSRNLTVAAAAAGVRHHIGLSMVGAGRLGDSGYFRGKAAQEKRIRESPTPYSIVHATLFFEFLGCVADLASEGGQVRLPPAWVQPVAADDVAMALLDCVFGTPSHDVVEVAGPERLRLTALVQRFLDAHRDGRRVVADADARFFGARLDDNALLPGPQARLGLFNFDTWFTLPKADG